MSEQYGAVDTHTGCALSFAPLVFSSDLAINSENCKLAHQKQQQQHTILRGMCWITARDTMIWDFKFMSVIASTCLTTSVVTSNFWQISWQLAWFRTRTLSFESFPSSKGMPVNNHSLTWRARYKDKVKQEQLCSEPSQLSSNSAGSSRSYYHISLKYRVSGKDGCPWLKINFLATN